MVYCEQLKDGDKKNIKKKEKMEVRRDGIEVAFQDLFFLNNKHGWYVLTIDLQKYKF